MTLTPAEIEILDAKAVNASRGLVNPIKVQFNPTEYNVTKGAQIAEIAIPGLDSPILQFIRGQNERLTLDLFFDTTRDGMGQNAKDVRTLTRSIYQLVKIQPETHAPPRIQFSWGGWSFKAIVENVQQKFALFGPTGVPLRATVSVSFREYKTLADQLEELNLRSADHTRRWVVKVGDTLTSIAYQVYNDSRLWRLIAERNREAVTNPRVLNPGAVLVIPPIEEASAAEVSS